jgi:hypothetical protein
MVRVSAIVMRGRGEADLFFSGVLPKHNSPDCIHGVGEVGGWSLAAEGDDIVNEPRTGGSVYLPVLLVRRGEYAAFHSDTVKIIITARGSKGAIGGLRK